MQHLMHSRGVPLPQLVRHQHPLLQRLALRVDELREQAGRAAFRQLVLDGGWALEAGAAHAFRFDPHAYPVPGNRRYAGKFRLSKHFYPVVAEYKGDHLRNVPKEIEKAQVGAVWAAHSGGRAVFAMLFRLERGMDLRQQIDAALG